MSTRIARLAPAFLALAMLSPHALADEQADRVAAVATATQEADQWLEAMDTRRYVDGWNESAAVVREGRTEQDWVQEFGAPREALGKPVMRELKRAEFSTRMRGAPEGEYVTAVYLTKFTSIPLVTETVLLTRESGHWRVGGYNVAPAPEAAPSSPPVSSPDASPGSTPPPKPKD